MNEGKSVFKKYTRLKKNEDIEEREREKEEKKTDYTGVSRIDRVNVCLILA